MDNAALDSVTVSKKIEVPQQIREALLLAESKLVKMDKSVFIEQELYDPSTHLLKSPGKLIRPCLVFSAAHTLKQNPNDFVDLAIGIELLHTASLIHDDIIDKDSVRRGKESVHSKFGLESAVLAGDALISKATQLTSAYGGNVVDIVSKAAMDMCAGEVLDYRHQQKKAQPDLDTYLKIAKLKTASLIAVSTSIVADYLHDKSRQHLYELGFNIGMSFQLRDDIMNHIGATDKASKPVKTDSQHSRPNIVSVFEKHQKENPLKTAVKLNNFYVDKASGALNSLQNPEIFNGYLKFLAIEGF